jgi:hypothetical protein
MKICFMFKPCRTTDSFELVLHGTIDRRALIDRITKAFNGKVTANSDFLTVIAADKFRISVSKSNRITIVGIKDESKAKIVANKIVSVLL